jgi:hypothetical protein
VGWRDDSARPCNNRPAVGVAALDAIFLTQLTVGMLSHNVPRGACKIFGADSNINVRHHIVCPGDMHRDEWAGVMTVLDHVTTALQ